MNKGKMGMTIAACALAGAMMIGGTFAYLTDTRTATNTFTVGNVKVELSEPDYPGNNDPVTKEQVPNQETAKNPQIKNTGANDAVVFMKVTVPVRTVMPVADDGTKGTAGPAEMYIFKQDTDSAAAHTNNFSKDWVELAGKEEGKDLSGKTRTYVFGYHTRISAGETTDPLFDKVQLKNFLEAEIEASDVLNIEIEGYAIQADNIVSGDGTLSTDAELNEQTLGTIYDTYVKQNASAGGQ